MKLKKYQTAGTKGSEEKDAQAKEVIPKDQVWEDGKIVQIVKTGAKTQRVVMGVYYVDDNGNKIKGLKPVEGTVPRQKGMGGKKYQTGGQRTSGQNPYLYENTMLSGSAGAPFGAGLNFNPRMNFGHASNMGDNASSLAKLGNLQIGANLGLNSRQNTLGVTSRYTQPLGTKGMGNNFLATGEAEIGAPLTNQGSGYGNFSTGLGYYNSKGNTMGIKGTLGANVGSTGHRAGKGVYGEVQGNYGPLNIFGGRGGQGNYGGIGVQIPLGKSENNKLKNRQTGGMYGDNTMSSAGQGNPQLGMSSTIVGQETDPALQEQRMQGLATSAQGLNTQSDQVLQQTRQQEGIDKQLAEQEAQQELNNFNQMNSSIASTVGQAGQFIGNRVPGNAPGPGSFADAYGMGKNAYNLTKAANMANDVSQMSEAAQLVTDAGGWIGSSADAAQTGTMVLDAAGNTVNAGSALGNAASSAMSAVPWGTVASYAGKGLSKLSDDNDATHSTAGEYGGKILERAGQGASIGSFFPGPGTAIGAGIGATIGGVEQFVGTRKAGRAEDKFQAEATTARNKGIYDLNQNIDQLYGSHMSNMAAGNMAQKTVSGQNLGRNVMYQSGGIMNKEERMDIPFSVSGQRFPMIPSEAHSQMMQNKVMSSDITPYGLKPNHPLAIQQKEKQTMNKMNQIQNFQKSQLTLKHGGVKPGMMMGMPRYGYNS